MTNDEWKTGHEGIIEHGADGCKRGLVCSGRDRRGGPGRQRTGNVARVMVVQRRATNPPDVAWRTYLIRPGPALASCDSDEYRRAYWSCATLTNIPGCCTLMNV